MPEVGKPKLFLSHSSADSLAAEQLKQALHASFDVFLDKTNLVGGDDWRRMIERELLECHCAVVLLSPNVLAKPEWVAVEAGHLAIMKRQIRADLQIVSVLMPGFANSDLSHPAFGPANLSQYQSVPLDLQNLSPLRSSLQPVIDAYADQLPLAVLQYEVAGVLDELKENAQWVLAHDLGLSKIDLQNAAGRSLWLAAKLLRNTELRALEKACRNLKTSHPAEAEILFRVVAPHRWVSGPCAQAVASAGASAPRGAIAMSATQPTTPRLYVNRASMRRKGWLSLECEAFPQDDEGEPSAEQALLANIRATLRQRAGFLPHDAPPSDASLFEQLDQPIFVVLPEWFSRSDPNLLNSLRTELSNVVFFIWRKGERDELKSRFPNAQLLTPLAEEDEQNIYRSYRRCLGSDSSNWVETFL